MITYAESVESITPEQMTGFFVGWPSPPSPEMHLKILRQSTHVEVAIDTESDHVVGFVNAVSDGVLAAYIPLLEVLPEYQKQGIGEELVKRLLEQIGPLYMIDVMCDEDVAPFYRRLGFRPYHGMMIRNHDSQSGG